MPKMKSFGSGSSLPDFSARAKRIGGYSSGGNVKKMFKGGAAGMDAAARHAMRGRGRGMFRPDGDLERARMMAPMASRGAPGAMRAMPPRPPMAGGAPPMKKGVS